MSVRGTVVGAALAGMLAWCIAGTASEALAERRANAKALLEIGDYGQAINAYEAIAVAYPDDAQAHYDLAAAQAFIQMYVDAVAPMTRARQLAPGEARYHTLAALVHTTLRQHELAFEAWLAAARLGNQSAMYQLVALFDEGRGTSRDQQQAAYWLQRAAETGYIPALEILVHAYEAGGYGLEVDLLKASAWRESLRQAEAALEREPAR